MDNFIILFKFTANKVNAACICIPQSPSVLQGGRLFLPRRGEDAQREEEHDVHRRHFAQRRALHQARDEDGDDGHTHRQPAVRTPARGKERA